MANYFVDIFEETIKIMVELFIGKKENYEDPKEFPIVHYLLFNNQ